MSVIAIANHKGGAAKTTTAIALCELFVSKGKKVLLVDADQQCNATMSFHARVENQSTIYDLLTEDFPDVKEAIQSTAYGDIIAGDSNMINVELDMAPLGARETRLVDALEPIRSAYDFIVIDCPPSLGLVTQNALIAADKVIVPMECAPYAYEGLNKVAELVRVIQSNKRFNPNLLWDGILLTKTEHNTNLFKFYWNGIPAQAAEFGTRVYQTNIRKCIRATEAQQIKQSLFEYAPECSAAKDYEALANELLERGI